MRKSHFAKNWVLTPGLFLLFAVVSCKKDNNSNNKTAAIIPTATPTTLGLYEGLYNDSAQYKVNRPIFIFCPDVVFIICL